MQDSLNNIFSSALVIGGIKLLHDFNRLNLYTLEVLLADMQFFIKKQVPHHPIFLYTSMLYKKEECTVVLIHPGHYIKKVRYLNYNLEKLFNN